MRGDFIKDFFYEVNKNLRDLEMYINADNLANIELFMTKIEDGVQDLREAIRKLIFPKKKTNANK